VDGTLIRHRSVAVSVLTELTRPLKGKAIPIQAWTVPEGSRRLRLLDFKTIGTCRW